MAAKIKRGDHVVVIAGKDKGTKGEVLKVFPKDQRVVVKGVAMVKRHMRPSQADPAVSYTHLTLPTILLV